MAIGLPIRRREDERLLRGHGRFVDDHRLAGAAHLVILRSPHAHARIRRLDTGAARAMPGVLAVLTGADWAKAGFGDLPCLWEVKFTDGRPMNEVTRPALVGDRVRHVGDSIAAVVAETREAAMDAAEAIEIDYEPLPAVVGVAAALADGALPVHEHFGTNLVFDLSFGDAAAIRAALAGAAHVTEIRLVNNRVAPAPLEPRAVAALYDPDDDKHTVWTSSQNPHLVRRWLAENSLKIPEQKIRVVAPDVGGGFGQKISHYPEEPIVLWAAKLLGRPVRWNGTRQENLLIDTQGRDHVTTCRMGFDAAGRIVAVDVDTLADVGAYVTAFGAAIPGYFYGPLLAGMYTTPAIHCRVRAAYTTTTPVDAYRGAGRPEATYVVERLIENGAREMGIDAAELRLRNFIQKAQFPYVSPVGMRYDSGDFQSLMRRIRETADYDGLRREQARLRGQGMLMGIGMAGFIDSAGGSPSRVASRMGRRTGSWDNAVVRVHPTGKVTAFCGGHSHGQGHATAFAQIVADRLAIGVDDVEIVEGDTDRIPYGHGTYGSRSLSVIGVAIAEATEKVVRKGMRIAAHLLECGEGDVVFEKGSFVIAGTDRSIPFQRIVHAAHHLDDYPAELEPGLEETAFYDPPGRNVPSALHLCVVLVDRETGTVRIRDFWSIDDVGRIVNPMIVEGQIHGGLAQGIGQALLEGVRFDASGQPLTGSFMDYAMPRAGDLPRFDAEKQETPSPDNRLGVKGAGESGTIGAPAAVANAVVDALWHLGIHHVDMPLTPLRVWSALRGGASQRRIS